MSVESFIKELTQLSKKHNLIIDGVTTTRDGRTTPTINKYEEDNWEYEALEGYRLVWKDKK